MFPICNRLSKTAEAGSRSGNLALVTLIPLLAGAHHAFLNAETQSTSPFSRHVGFLGTQGGTLALPVFHCELRLAIGGLDINLPLDALLPCPETRLCTSFLAFASTW